MKGIKLAAFIAYFQVIFFNPAHASGILTERNDSQVAAPRPASSMRDDKIHVSLPDYNDPYYWDRSCVRILKQQQARKAARGEIIEVKHLDPVPFGLSLVAFGGTAYSTDFDPLACFLVASVGVIFNAIAPLFHAIELNEDRILKVRRLAPLMRTLAPVFSFGALMMEAGTAQAYVVGSAAVVVAEIAIVLFIIEMKLDQRIARYKAYLKQHDDKYSA